jgi:hypothetical protein
MQLVFRGLTWRLGSDPFEDLLLKLEPPVVAGDSGRIEQLMPECKSINNLPSWRKNGVWNLIGILI